jgi:hypothetical protein
MKISRKSATFSKHYICHFQGEYDNRNVRQKLGKSSFVNACHLLVSIDIPTGSTIYLFIRSQYNIIVDMHEFTYKRRTLVGANAPKNTPGNSFYMFRQQTNLWHFLRLTKFLFCFPQSVVYFIILSFLLFTQYSRFSYTMIEN